MIKIKHILSLFIFGLLLNLTGGLFKIMHWQGAHIVLIAGTITKLIAGIVLIYKILTNTKFKGFLNW